MADEQPNLAEYTTWCTLEGRAEPKATAARLIKSAARLVESYLRCCTRRGSAGEAEAIRDAIYMQVAFWEENQLTPGAEALKATQVTQASLMGASVHYAGAEQAAQARWEASQVLCFEARLTLGLAGIHLAQPEVIG